MRYGSDLNQLANPENEPSTSGAMLDDSFERPSSAMVSQSDAAAAQFQYDNFDYEDYEEDYPIYPPGTFARTDRLNNPLYPAMEGSIEFCLISLLTRP